MGSFRFIGVAALVTAFAMVVNGCSGAGGIATGPASPRVAALQTQLALLEKEADRARDAHDIRRLQRAYGYYLDQAQWDEIAELFTPDGTIEIGLDGVYAGQARIREYLYRLGGGRRGLVQGQLNEHFVVQPVVHVAPDGMTALGRWRSVIMAGEYGKSATVGDGVYEVRYAKQNGVWKIAQLHWYQTFMVPYAGGWAKNEDVNGGVYVSKQLPPDRPPTERYGVWPNVYVPPFHYKNPTADSMPAIPLDTAPDADPAVAALQQAIAQLQRRIQALHDRGAIENLVSMYGYYLDKQQWDLLTDLFAEDSTMEISQRGVYHGHKSIRKAFELFGPQNIEPEHVHNHIQLQPLITIAPDGQRAWIRSRALSELGTFHRVGVWGDGVYENEVVKVNGVWKIKHDHVYTTFFTTYDEGWAFGSRPTPKPSTQIPPDSPATVKYESFPEVFTPAFHYKNPVTGGDNVAQPEIAVTAVPASVRPALTRLVQKVTQLEDANAIENLQRAYGFYADKALWKDCADLFAENGTLEIGGRGVFAGRAHVLQHLRSLAPEGLTYGQLMNHLQLQPIVTVAPDGKTARGRWHFLAQIGTWQKSQLWGIGTYENQYVKENGVWKIQSLHSFSRMFTPYADGWAKTALPLTAAGSEMPPDRPPTVKYEPYPGTFVPPFHYTHPVR
ncbi:MAG TPA: nuclear transport factor 2 family protein [Steroidobacteraceae bacterium]|nr:nuclear transport factor 2 family protein [Steroidobacteraceae bacterium]